MPELDRSLRSLAATVGAAVLGAVGTAVLAIGLLRLFSGIRRPIYRAFYLAVGPWSATTAAVVLTFVGAALLGTAVVTVGVGFLRDDAAEARTLARTVPVAIALSLVVLLGAVAVSAIGFRAALIAVGVFVVAVPVGVHWRGAWPSGMAAFAGSVPVLALLLLLLAFGLGWGGGYDAVAREVPADTVDGPVAADFAAGPELRDDWLTPTGESPAAHCETNASGVGTCRLSLRAYDRERVAGRFMARHGVTCPFLHDPAPATSGNRSFTAVDGGTHYRVSCIAYGD